MTSDPAPPPDEPGGHWPALRDAPPAEEASGGPADALARIAARFRHFAEHSVAHLPLYRRLCAAAADDRDVAARLLVARPGQRVPNLLLASVHDVLLAGADDPLGAWYGSVTEHPRTVGNAGHDPWPAFRRMALEHEGVDERLRTRVTQTNEVGRCATLLPALDAVALDAPGATPGAARPLGLVEIGCSAGLNLLLDRFGYRYEPDGRVVNDASLLVLTCRFRGRLRPRLPAGAPHIASRVGIDRDPVDIGDRAAARWLVACQWPEQPERIHRTRTALALAHGDRPRVVQGDAVDDLPALVTEVPDHALPVVVSTWVLAYLSEQRRRALVERLDALGRHRDLTFVGAELPSAVPGVPVPPRPDGRPDDAGGAGPTALFRLDWRDGRRSTARLADQHPHGTWLEWLVPDAEVSGSAEPVARQGRPPGTRGAPDA